MSSDSSDDNDEQIVSNVQSFDDEESEGNNELNGGDGDDDYDANNQSNDDEEKVDFVGVEHQVSAAIRLRREQKEQKLAAEGISDKFGNVDEHLGDDFEDTPWVAPTLEVVSVGVVSVIAFDSCCVSRLGSGD
jgi:hypothetical protein